MLNFALIGAAGYVAPRHMKAIRDTGNSLVAVTDPSDSVGVIDRYFPRALYFREIERFEEYLEHLRFESHTEQVSYTSICSPNYLHAAHIGIALRQFSNVICEKPLALSSYELDRIEWLETDTGYEVYTVLQLRLLPALIELRNKIQAAVSGSKKEVELTYVTPRGDWYHRSWKGDPTKSGGLAMNIGVHLFDLLLWVFGECYESTLHLKTAEKVAGRLEFQNASVTWFLSTDRRDLPVGHPVAEKPAYRSLKVDGEEIEFSTGFTDMHTEVYRHILNGQGFKLSDVRPAIELIHLLGTTEPRFGYGKRHSNLNDVR